MTTQLDPESRAFPPAVPDNLDDAATIIENDWRAFGSVTRMSDHWARPGWNPGHRAHYWMFTFNGSGHLAAEAAFGQRAIADFRLDDIPADGLHITMNQIGGSDTIAAATLDRLASAAARGAGPAFEIQAHPMAGSRGSVRFTVTPWTPLVRLHGQLAHLGRQLDLAGCKPTSRFRPHMGIAYSNRAQAAEPLIAAVAQLRHRPPVTLEISHIDMVELRREDRVYRWDTLHRIPLEPRP